MRFITKLAVFVFFVSSALAGQHAFAQVAAASRGGASQINVFGMFAFGNTDYGEKKDYGGSFGGDYRFGKLGPGQLAIAGRFTIQRGPTTNLYNSHPGVYYLNQDSFIVGPEYHINAGRHLKPYVGFQLGYGTLSATQGSYSDNAFVYSVGGGLDYKLKKKWSIRAIDAQYQNWNLGTASSGPQKGKSVTYTPYQIGFGVSYRIK